MPSAAQTYRDNAILSASPSRLLTMLYDRLLLDLNVAKDALDGGDHAIADYRLSHAVEIISALAGSLRLDVWDGAEGLLGLYIYLSNALLHTRVNKDVALVVEAIALLEPLRQAWHQAADSLASQPSWEVDASNDRTEVVAVA
jgi:flagellar protein FliS